MSLYHTEDETSIPRTPSSPSTCLRYLDFYTTHLFLPSPRHPVPYPSLASLARGLTLTLTLVPTTVPDAGLVCILWRCSAVVVSFISDASYLVFVVSLHVVFPSQTLQCTRPGSRSSHVLYSVSRMNQLNS